MQISSGILLEKYLAISRAIAGQMDFQSVLGEIADELYQLFEHGPCRHFHSSARSTRPQCFLRGWSIHQVGRDE